MLNYLALGDSYTIGEQLHVKESFPYQTIQLLRENSNLNFNDPTIIAKTGWTTDELIVEVEGAELLKRYDFVSLLIGVNNQYRNYPIIQFEKEFEILIKKAIDLVDGISTKVIVLSIPDYGVTPYSKDKDILKIGKELQVYNDIALKLSKTFNTHFVNITDLSFQHGKDNAYLTPDLLHYSSKAYGEWAKRVAEKISDIYII